MIFRMSTHFVRLCYPGTDIPTMYDSSGALNLVKWWALGGALGNSVSTMTFRIFKFHHRLGIYSTNRWKVLRFSIWPLWVLQFVGGTEPRFGPFNRPRQNRVPPLGPGRRERVEAPSRIQNTFCGSPSSSFGFLFLGYRFRPIVIFSPGCSLQFHPHSDFPGLCAWWLAKFPIHQEKSYDSPSQTRISYDASGFKYSRPKKR